MSFTIEALLDKRKGDKNLVEYLVSWRGYGSEEDTWELRKNLVEDGHMDMINEYEAAAKAKSPRKTPKKKASKSPAPKGRGRTPARRTTSKRGSKSPAASKSPAPKPKSAKKPATRGRAAASKGKTPTKRASRSPTRSPSASRSPSRSASPASKRSPSPAKDEKERAAPPQSGSYANIADNVNTSASDFAWVSLYLAAFVGYIICENLSVSSLTTCGSDECKKMSNAMWWVRAVSGPAGPALACWFVYNKPWGKSFEFSRFLCIAIVWMWADALISEIADPGATADAKRACEMMSFLCSTVAHLAITVAFSKVDEGKGAVPTNILRAIPFVALAGVVISSLLPAAYFVAQDFTMKAIILGYIVSVAVSSWRVAARVGYGFMSSTAYGAMPQWVALLGSFCLVTAEFIRRGREFGFAFATKPDDTVQMSMLIKSTQTLALTCFTLSPWMGLSRLEEIKED